MKTKLLFFFLILLFLKLNAQKQITNFVYPKAPYTPAYKHFSSKNDTKYTWYFSVYGVYAFNLNTQKSTKIMLNDSLPATSILSFSAAKNGKGIIVLRDSVNRVYICDSYQNQIVILKRFDNPNAEYGDVFSNEDGVFFYSNNQTIFRVKDSKISVVGEFKNSSRIISSDSNFLALDWKQVMINGISKEVVIKENYPFVFKNNFYLNNVNSLIKLTKPSDKLIIDTLFTSKSRMFSYIKNDSLFLEEADTSKKRNIIWKSDGNTFSKAGDKEFSNFNYFSYENNSFRFSISYFNYSGGTSLTSVVSFKQNMRESYVISKNTTSSNSLSAYLYLEKIYQKDSIYLLHWRYNNTHTFVRFNVNNPSKDYQQGDLFRINSDSTIDCGLNNWVFRVNLKNLKLEYNINLNKKDSIDTNGAIIDFKIGDKNLAYSIRNSRELNLLKEFKNNNIPIFLKSENGYKDVFEYFYNDLYFGQFLTYPS
jgi:hypothetical protein